MKWYFHLTFKPIIILIHRRTVCTAFKPEFGFFILFSCIVYFVYFTNYLRVCIFVYLLTINFVRVLIVYFQNIVYSCITINFTISYVIIAHTYYIPVRAITVYTFVPYMNLHITVLFIPHF